MAAFGRQNTFQVAIASASATPITLKLPNGSTGALPAGQTPTVLNPIGVNQRWRVTMVTASFGVAAVSTPVSLTVTDGKVTYVFDVAAPLILNPVDWQLAAGAEVDFTLGAGTGAIGHVNVSAQVE